MSGIVFWVLGIVLWVSGFVLWVSGIVFWVLGIVSWVLPQTDIFVQAESKTWPLAKPNLLKPALGVPSLVRNLSDSSMRKCRGKNGHAAAARKVQVAECTGKKLKPPGSC